MHKPQTTLFANESNAKINLLPSWPTTDNMIDMGAPNTTNKSMKNFCQNDGGGDGEKPKNCHKLIGGKTTMSRPQVSQNRRRLMPVVIKNVLANFFISMNVA